MPDDDSTEPFPFPDIDPDQLPELNDTFVGDVIEIPTPVKGPNGLLSPDGTPRATAKKVTKCQAEIAAAKRYLGWPYSFAGGNCNGPSRGRNGKVGFDCSGEF